MDEKNKTHICCLQDTHLKDTGRLKVKGWRTIYHSNINQKQATVIILISGKADFEK